jgi:short-subunit dehydrogenase
LIQSGIAHHSIKADFNDQESFTKMLHDIYALYPKIDLLINNASIFEFDTATNFEPDTLKKHLQINAIAPTMLISNIIKKQAGKLFAINMLDIMTQKHTKGYFSYNLSKRMLETSSYLINNSASNVAIENLYLNKIDTTEDLESLLLKLSIKLKEHFVA